jgi:hypothetical protein
MNRTPTSDAAILPRLGHSGVVPLKGNRLSLEAITQ